jgi:hypothetical protein
MNEPIVPAYASEILSTPLNKGVSPDIRVYTIEALNRYGAWVIHLYATVFNNVLSRTDCHVFQFSYDAIMRYSINKGKANPDWYYALMRESIERWYADLYFVTPEHIRQFAVLYAADQNYAKVWVIWDKPNEAFHLNTE